MSQDEIEKKKTKNDLKSKNTFGIIALYLILVIAIITAVVICWHFIPAEIKGVQIKENLKPFAKRMIVVAEFGANVVVILGLLSVSIQLQEIRKTQLQQEKAEREKKQDKTHEIILEFAHGAYKSFCNMQNPPIFWQNGDSLKKYTDFKPLIPKCEHFMQKNNTFASDFSNIAMELEIFSQDYSLCPDESKKKIMQTLSGVYIKVFEVVCPVILQDKQESFCRTALSVYSKFILFESYRNRKAELEIEKQFAREAERNNS